MTSTVKRGCDHIFFVGFLGAGKSTLARNRGRMLQRRFVESDRLVERKCGQTVSQIFEAEGEQRFRTLETEALESLASERSLRTLETEALESLASERSLLVSCGGGVVETPRNIELIHEMGFCVYLEGDIALETEALESLASERSLLVSCGGGVVETPRNIELIHEMGFCVYLEGDIDDSLRQIRRSDTRPDFRSAEHAARHRAHPRDGLLRLPRGRHRRFASPDPPLRHPTRFSQRRACRPVARA